ncbi:coiled-coil protein [Legionella busanensis]|uniref:Coiled-coil protein n=1 Tax=Legionella busanensis TaxID=190655 RepID=A0A378JX77_9GAMM|nr:HlyD family efflux transporter periplasmic adaptor subunit [Legionella busanensis]STX52832.1 coiled-coil protein [Legionella busanensis]
MGILLRIENKKPLIPAPPPGARKLARLRWLLLVLLLCLPLGYLSVRLIQDYIFVRFSGIIIYDTLLVRAPDEGYIKSMSVHTGESVRPGDLILEIDSPKLNNKLMNLIYEKERISKLIINVKKFNQDELVNSLKVAEKDMIDSQKTYEKFKEYFKGGNLITLQLEEARKNYTAAQQNYASIKQKMSEIALHQNTSLEVNYNRRLAEVESDIKVLKTHLKNFTVRAPQQGTVMSIETHVGEYVPIGKDLLTIVTNDNLQIKAYIEPKYSAVATHGSKVTIQLPNNDKIPGIIINDPRYAQQLPSSETNPLATRQNKLIAIIAPRKPIPKEYQVYGIPVQINLD